MISSSLSRMYRLGISMSRCALDCVVAMSSCRRFSFVGSRWTDCMLNVARPGCSGPVILEFGVMSLLESNCCVCRRLRWVISKFIHQHSDSCRRSVSRDPLGPRLWNCRHLRLLSSTKFHQLRVSRRQILLLDPLGPRQFRFELRAPR